IVFSVVILKVYVCAAAKFLNTRGQPSLRDPAKQNFREVPCRLFVRNIQQTPIFVPKNIVERMVYQHAEKCSDGNARLNIAQCSVFLPAANIFADKPVHLRNKITEELFRQLVLLESRIKE